MGFPGTPPSLSRTSGSHTASLTKENLEYLTVMPFLSEDYKSISYLWGPEILWDSAQRNTFITENTIQIQQFLLTRKKFLTDS